MIRTKEYQRFQNKVFNTLVGILDSDKDVNFKTLNTINCFDLGEKVHTRYQNVKVASIAQSDILVALHLQKNLVSYYSDLGRMCIFHTDKWNKEEVLSECELYFKNVESTVVDKNNSLLICKRY